MSQLYDSVIIHWLDKNNEPSESNLTTIAQDTTGTGPYVALASALQAVSECAITAIERRTVLPVVATPGDGPYCTVFDRGTLYSVITTTGRGTRVNILGPKEDIFGPEHQMIDLADPRIITLQTQAMSLLGDQNGNAMGPFQRGIRQQAKVY